MSDAQACASQLEQRPGQTSPRLHRLAHHDRPQAHRRAAIIVTAFIFFCSAGSLAAVMRMQLARPEQHAGGPGPLQPALHHARHDDDVPLRRADHGGAWASTWCR